MLRKSGIAQVICLFFISIQVMQAQLVTKTIAMEDRIKLTVQDTISYLKLPKRLENAMGGAEFVKQVAGLSEGDREKAIVRAILSGNVPSFSRILRPLQISQIVDGKIYELIFFVRQDYLTIGSDEDYLYIPMSPLSAQSLANELACSLPTKLIVDSIYNKAIIQLAPQPIPPSDSMTSIPVFKQHTDSIVQQLLQRKIDRLASQIIAGHKKDIILSNSIYSKNKTSGSVVIYGWHLGKNKPIQPVYNGHHIRYADYSHGTRLIANLAFLNGAPIPIDTILKDPNLSILLSHEGVIPKPNYPVSDNHSVMKK